MKISRKKLLKLRSQAAQHRLENLQTVIGVIAGAAGKTTTKELVAHIFKGSNFKTFCSRGNLNGNYGTAVSLLSIPHFIEYAVLEVGIDAPKAMSGHLKMIKPDFGLMTNIGLEHLNKLKNISQIANEEMKLFDYLDVNFGTIIINADDQIILGRSKKYKQAQKFFYSFNKRCPRNLWIQGILKSNRNFKIVFPNGDSITVTNHLFGTQSYQNLLAAICLCYVLGLTPKEIKRGVAGFHPPHLRNQFLKRNGYLLIADMYNATPLGMKTSLADLFMQFPGHKKILILGDMLDLGSKSVNIHQQIARYLKPQRNTSIIFIGKHFFKTRKLFRLRKDVEFFLSFEKAIPKLEKLNCLGKVVFVKGSRSLKLEQTLKII